MKSVNTKQGGAQNPVSNKIVGDCLDVSYGRFEICLQDYVGASALGTLETFPVKYGHQE
jgi:hypothetical protein